jgi:hypothetical protein
MNLAAASRSEVVDPPFMCPRILLQEERKAEFEKKRG